MTRLRPTLALLVLAAFVPPLAALDNDAPRRDQLKRLRAAITAFGMMNPGKAPEKLSQLVDENLVDGPGSLLRPGSRDAVPPRAELDARADYTLEPLGAASDIVVREKAPLPGERELLAIFKDGTVKALAAGETSVATTKSPVVPSTPKPTPTKSPPTGVPFEQRTPTPTPVPAKSATVTPSTVPAVTAEKITWKVTRQLVLGLPWPSATRGEAELRAAIVTNASTPDQRLVDALNDLGGWFRGQGRFAEAARVYRRVLTVQVDRGLDQHHDFALTNNDRAVVATEGGQLREAEGLFKSAIEIWETRWSGPMPTEDFAVTLHNYAMLLEKLGRPAEAKEFEARAVEIMTRRRNATGTK